MEGLELMLDDGFKSRFCREFANALTAFLPLSIKNQNKKTSAARDDEN